MIPHNEIVEGWYVIKYKHSKWYGFDFALVDEPGEMFMLNGYGQRYIKDFDFLAGPFTPELIFEAKEKFNDLGRKELISRLDRRDGEALKKAALEMAEFYGNDENYRLKRIYTSNVGTAVEYDQGQHAKDFLEKHGEK